MRALAFVLTFTLCFAVSACGGSADEAAQQTTARPIETQPVESAPAGAGREKAPALAGTSLDGERLALVDLRGRPVLVNVWSSW
jgi:cytochrome oxidase Cu insertion factor (SCO1/SenC/PrrC family)